jgi:hypothetical protein
MYKPDLHLEPAAAALGPFIGAHDPRDRPFLSLRAFCDALALLRDSDRDADAAALLALFGAEVAAECAFVHRDCADSEVSGAILALLDPAGRPQLLGPVMAALSPWTCWARSGVSLFEADLLFFDVAFDLALTRAFPCQAHVTQALANLLEDSEALCAKFAGRSGFMRFLNSVADGERSIRGLCVLRLVSAFLRTRPATFSAADFTLFEKFKYRFDNALTECDAADFLFLKRYIKWSSQTYDYFVAQMNIHQILKHLADFSDDRLIDLFSFIFRVMELFQNKDARSLWKIPYDQFVDCFNIGYLQSGHPRSSDSQLAYVKFMRRAIDASPIALDGIATPAGLGLLGHWVDDGALSVRQASAGLLCEIARYLRYPLELFNTAGFFASACQLLAEIDDARLALSLVVCVDGMVGRMGERGRHGEIFMALGRDGVWDRLEEIAFDPDGEVGPDASAKLQSIASGRAALGEALEAVKESEEIQKNAEVWALRDVEDDGVESYDDTEWLALDFTEIDPPD